MNRNELGEDLEQQFGKPRNITEENVRFVLSLIKVRFPSYADEEIKLYKLKYQIVINYSADTNWL